MRLLPGQFSENPKKKLEKNHIHKYVSMNYDKIQIMIVKNLVRFSLIKFLVSLAKSKCFYLDNSLSRL